MTERKNKLIKIEKDEWQGWSKITYKIPRGRKEHTMFIMDKDVDVDNCRILIECFNRDRGGWLLIPSFDKSLLNSWL